MRRHRPQRTSQSMGATLGRVATELVPALRWERSWGGFDGWFGTSPLFMVVMFFLQAAAGMLNVWRMASGRGMATGYLMNIGSRDRNSPADRSSADDK